MQTQILITTKETDYELLDSGLEEKLERYGSVTLARPDPQALWEKRLPEDVWKKADGWFERKGKTGEWHTRADFPKEWEVSLGGLQFLIRPTTFKHTGLFPEQRSNWEWIEKQLQPVTSMIPSDPTKRRLTPPQVLNLFAYTGGATLAALRAGASVTHVDASKTAVSWAKENAERSGMGEKPVRWIVDDVMAFVNREIKRESKYDAIIMDPPAFGHGPKDELWKIEEDFLELIRSCHALLSETPLFVLASGYASGYSSVAFANSFELFVTNKGGSIECGELAIQESNTDRLLPAGIFSRWSV